MFADGVSKQLDPAERTLDVLIVAEKHASPRWIPRTTIGLCGLGMFLVGSGMPLAVNKGGWLCLALAGMLILMLAMWMLQERWLTRERHRLIASALKRTAAPGGSGRSEENAPRRTHSLHGGKPVETGSASHGQGKRAGLGQRGTALDSPHAPDGEATGGMVTGGEEPSNLGHPRNSERDH